MEKRGFVVTAGLVALLAITPARGQNEDTDPDVQKAVKDSNTLQSEPESVSEGADTSAAPPAQTDRGITYRNGGVGKDERDALLLVTKSYSLKVVLAGSGDRAFVAEATLRILDGGGKTVLEASDVGPLFFADLPGGTYTVEASLHERTQKKTVTLKKGRQTPISFTW